jgi:hypothetical protein
MKFTTLYITAIVSGLIGAVGGAFAGGVIAAAQCDGGLECLGAAFLGVGLGTIVLESLTMSLMVHKVNHSRGHLMLTFLPTIVLPIPFALLPGVTAPLALPLFLLQAWVCVKLQLATVGKKRIRKGPVRLQIGL